MQDGTYYAETEAMDNTPEEIIDEFVGFMALCRSVRRERKEEDIEKLGKIRERVAFFPSPRSHPGRDC